MNSLAIADRTINVPFYGASLYIVNHNGEPYTPMKPIVEGMGMDWKSQFIKLKQRFKTCVVEITMQLPGDNQRRSVICLALRKLNGWLQTISPNKVRPEIRERVIQYQEECDDVLYDYWTKGQAINPRKTSTDERTPLRDAINMLVGKRGIMYPEAYSYVHQRFNVTHIDELPAEQLTFAVEYVHRLALEGELLPKEDKPVAVEIAPFAFDFETYANNARVAENHINFIYQAWCEEISPALRALGSPVAAKLGGRIRDVAALAHNLKHALGKASKGIH